MAHLEPTIFVPHLCLFLFAAFYHHQLTFLFLLAFIFRLNCWVLEFIDLGGEMRRDVWHALISEVIALHKFICEYGPDDSDGSLFNVYGARKGKETARANAINGIARIQALQRLRKLLDDPTKLVQFSYLQNAPHGDVVYQTLVVSYWSGPLVTGFVNTRNQPENLPSGEIADSHNHVFDIDGSVYLQKWMKSFY